LKALSLLSLSLGTSLRKLPEQQQMLTDKLELALILLHVQEERRDGEARYQAFYSG